MYLRMSFMFLALFSALADAAQYRIQEVPTSIYLESYPTTAPQIALWRLPTPGQTTWPSSACLYLYIPDTAQVSQQNRLFNLLAVAKMTSSSIFLLYDTVSCEVFSFGMA